MKQNVGILDTGIRGTVTIFLLAFAAEGVFGPMISILLLVAGAALWVSCSTGVCFLYKALGIDTYPNGGHGIYQHY